MPDINIGSLTPPENYELTLVFRYIRLSNSLHGRAVSEVLVRALSKSRKVR